jgi:phosphatidyl-myo-inositol alpha-mannosyltransferase
MRILHVINGEHYAGAERVQDLLALRLLELGYEVGFACIKPDKFPEQRIAKSAPLYLVPMSSRFDIRAAFKLARIVSEEGYSLVHTHTVRGALVGRIASVLARVPMVHHVHSPVARDTESPIRNYINTVIEYFSRVGVNRFIPVSKSLGAYLRSEGVEPSRISIVANGVPTLEQLMVREAPGPEWVIGCVALFRPRKGIEVLIDALAILRGEGFLVQLRAVGGFESADYEAEIMSLANRRGVVDIIEWVGFTEDVNKELAMMDVFVLPSLFGEGMPMVILEAMAMGVPVVASEVEGVPEIVENRNTGLIVPPGDPVGLAKALAKVMSDRFDWRGVRKAAYARQGEKFSDASMTKSVAGVYQDILK